MPRPTKLLRKQPRPIHVFKQICLSAAAACLVFASAAAVSACTARPGQTAASSKASECPAEATMTHLCAAVFCSTGSPGKAASTGFGNVDCGTQSTVQTLCRQPPQIHDVITGLTFLLCTDKLHGLQLPPHGLHSSCCRSTLTMCLAD